ncbi:MAG: flagellar biosynthesis anti-sigma factor FlgM [Pseudomonadota bacterium]|jgi:flagellar biosynthesis anti-sigma factor FlgM
MKVPGSDGNTDALKRVKGESVNEGAIKRRQAGQTGLLPEGPEGVTGEQAKSKGDTFTVSPLAAKISEQLSAKTIAEERRAKVNSIKEQIKNGTYQPPLELVAEAISEEINLEVLLSGNGYKA